MILKVLIDENVIINTLIIVTFENGSCIGTLFDFVDLDGNLSIFRSLLLLDLRIISDGSGNNCLEPWIDNIFLLNSFPGHTHRQLFIGLLEGGDLHTGLTHFLSEVEHNIVIFLRIVFD